MYKLKLNKIRSLQEFIDYNKNIDNDIIEFEQHLAHACIDNIQLALHGYCQVCNKPSEFLLDMEYSNGIIPNYRERLVCSSCNLNNRQRFMYASLVKSISEIQSPCKSVYLYEQVTRFYQYTKENLGNVDVVGSEYISPDLNSGEITCGIRHENAEKLSFQDESFDIIISNDVYEHVNDIEKAVNEVYRVLKTGGKLLFSIPFYRTEQSSTRRAIINKNGEPENILPAIYHGNPVSKDGSLVIHDFGWDLIDLFRNTGFKDAYMITYHSLFYSYLGYMQITFAAEK